MSVFWRPRGCVLWFDFAELQGDTVYDLSGNGNHGTIYNCEWRRGHLVGSLYFNGTDAYVRVPTAPSIQNFTSLSIEMLIKAPVTEHAVDYLDYGYFVDPYGILFESAVGGISYIAVFVRNTSGDATHIRIYFTPNEWTLITATYDGTKIRGYKNGTLQDQSPFSGTLACSSHDLFLGCRHSYINYFDGLIAHVRIYNRALSEREIKAHANYLLQKYIAHPPFI